MNARFPLIALLGMLALRMSVAQSPEQLRSLLPSLEGWTTGRAEVFNPDNLYDRINGAAPLFLAYNFREMTAVDYRKGDDYITVQAYRHAAPEDAFGMYASERSPEIPFIDGTGGEAQGDAENFFFFAGSIYVKMAAHCDTDASEAMKRIAQGLASGIDPRPSYPPMLSLLPTEGRIAHSEVFISSSFIGHDFLKSVYAASYQSGGSTYQLFIIDGKTAEGALGILKQYLAFTKQTDSPGEGAITIRDRYNGDIPAFLKGSCIVGLFSESGGIAGGEAIVAAVAGRLK
ncbi:MAG: hypothetical protein LBD21_00335 [Tannerellaceae bacterium]|jgi:hypothetical protein|nr:hypothetical protein [Tannerellaceae bacterium]